MSERRVEKLGVLMREELSRIIDRECEFPMGIMVTVTRVVISSDKHYAKAYISVLGRPHRRAIEILQKNVYHIQQAFNRKVRIRPVPRVRFEIDEEEERREDVEKSLAKLKKKGEI